MRLLEKDERCVRRENIYREAVKRKKKEVIFSFFNLNKEKKLTDLIFFRIFFRREFILLILNIYDYLVFSLSFYYRQQTITVELEL